MKRIAGLRLIISQVTPSESSVTKKVAYEPLFLAHLRDHLGSKASSAWSCTSADQCAARDLPEFRAWHAEDGSVARAAWRRQFQAQCGKIVIGARRRHRSRQTRCGVLVARLSRQSGRGRASRALRRGPWPEIGAAGKRLTAPDRRDAESTRCRLSRCQRANTWSTRRVIWDELGLPPLNPRRLGMAIRWATGATIGRIRAARGGGPLGDHGGGKRSPTRKGLETECG